MVARGLAPTGCAADPPSARAEHRAGRAWRRRPGCDPPRDQPPDAIAHSRDRLGNYENTPRSRATTGNSTPPTRPPQSTVPNPATPALSLPFASAPPLPRSAAGAGLRLPNRSRRHKRAGGGRTGGGGWVRQGGAAGRGGGGGAVGGGGLWPRRITARRRQRKGGGRGLVPGGAGGMAGACTRPSPVPAAAADRRPTTRGRVAGRGSA